MIHSHVRRILGCICYLAWPGFLIFPVIIVPARTMVLRIGSASNRLPDAFQLVAFSARYISGSAGICAFFLSRISSIWRGMHSGSKDSGTGDTVNKGTAIFFPAGDISFFIRDLGSSAIAFSGGSILIFSEWTAGGRGRIRLLAVDVLLSCCKVTKR